MRSSTIGCITNLELHLELTLSQSHDLTGIAKSIWTLLADSFLLVSDDRLSESLLVSPLGLHRDLVLLEGIIKVVGVSGVGESCFEGFGRRGHIVGGAAGGILALVGIGTTGKVIGSALTGKRFEAKTFEVGASLRRGTIVDLSAMVHDEDLVEEVVDTFASLIPGETSQD